MFSDLRRVINSRMNCDYGLSAFSSSSYLIVKPTRPGKFLLPVQLCLSAISSGLAHSSSLFYLLAGCLQIDCKATRKAVTAALPGILKGPKEVFEFWECHKEVFKRVARTDFGGREFGKEKIFIGGVPGDVEEEELFELFSRFGRVTSVEHEVSNRC